MMKIGELAAATGLPPSRIRFYERTGLLQSVVRRRNGYRGYGPQAIAELELIIAARQAGFGLDAIRALLPSGDGRWQHDRLVGALEEKVREIAALEQALAENRRRLLSIIEDIQARPEGLDCGQNAGRVLARLRSPESDAG